jgi:hypothetical protein
MTPQAHPRTADADHDEPNDQQGIDLLVELHVLAEHRDTVSASVAQRWIATDERGRRVWEQRRPGLRSTPPLKAIR